MTPQSDPNPDPASGGTDSGDSSVAGASASGGASSGTGGVAGSGGDSGSSGADSGANGEGGTDATPGDAGIDGSLGSSGAQDGGEDAAPPVTCGFSNVDGAAPTAAVTCLSFIPNSITPDGSIIVGMRLDGPGQFPSTAGVIWKKGSESELKCENRWMNGLSAASNDGSVIVGGCVTGPRLGSSNAFRWTAQTGFVFLGGESNPATPVPVSASDVSADGRVVVGSFFLGGPAAGPYITAQLWTEETGFQILSPSSAASAVSGDGLVVVGTTRATPSRAFRWISASGLEILPSEEPARANGISADGRVTVGYQSDPAQEALRWTSQGAQSLGCTYCAAKRTSGDGSVIIGQQYLWNNADKFLSDLHPFVWDEVHGLRQFPSFLQAYGLKVETKVALIDVSDDGRVLVGGTYGGAGPGGLSKGFVLTLPESPATSRSDGGP